MPDAVPIAPASVSSSPSQLAHRSRDHPIEAQARIELVRIAYRELKGGTFVSAGATIAFAVAISTKLASPLLWAWLGCMLAFLGLRLWLAAAFNRKEPSPAEFPRWGLRYIVATTLTAFGWGASVW